MVTGRLTDHLIMTIVVDWVVKPQNNNNSTHCLPQDGLMICSVNVNIGSSYKPLLINISKGHCHIDV